MCRIMIKHMYHCFNDYCRSMAQMKAVLRTFGYVYQRDFCTWLISILILAYSARNVAVVMNQTMDN